MSVRFYDVDLLFHDQPISICHEVTGVGYSPYCSHETRTEVPFAKCYQTENRQVNCYPLRGKRVSVVLNNGMNRSGANRT